MSAQGLLPQVQAVLGALRGELVARHGWTHLEVSARVEPEARRIVLHGEVAVDRLVARVIAVVQAVAPGWVIDESGVQPMSGGSWHVLHGSVALLAERPGVDVPRRVATELRPQDGPVQRLGQVGGVTVVRGRDGTVGWLEGPLGPEVAAPRLPWPHGEDPLALVAAARPWVGVPYRLGGISEQGVDCSGLVQRLVLEVLGVLLPRHSSDQLLVAPRAGEGRGPGDLSFVWSDREALCHVGIGTGHTVVHASLSRRCVVEDSMGGFLAGVRRVMHVPFAELLALGQRTAGQPSLFAAGFRLGLEPTS
jgi:cell wall-associated NlpC family hydrolase